MASGEHPEMDGVNSSTRKGHTSWLCGKAPDRSIVFEKYNVGEGAMA